MAWMGCVPIGLTLIYLFLIAPHLSASRKRIRPFMTWDFAHRGLHGDGVPENSLAAFDRAARRGYGIEMDVRLTGDGKLAVLHDETLLRMCGVNAAVQSLTLEQVHAYCLSGTEMRVPSFDQVLDAVGGRVPLLVEIKPVGGAWRQIAPKVLEKMREYRGLWCVESFDPRILWWFRTHKKDVVRGQLAFDPRRIPGEERRGLLFFLGAHLMLNWLGRPDFIAYEHVSAGNFSFRLMKRLFCPPVAAWTVQSTEDYQRLKKNWDIRIFEGFEPKRVHQ